MYTPTPEFIAALGQIDAIRDDTNSPEAVISLASATRSALMELAAKQQMLQTMVEEQGSQELRASRSLETRETEPQEVEPGTVLEAVPPLPPPPPGLYGAPRNEDGTGASVRPAGLYEAPRNADGSTATE